MKTPSGQLLSLEAPTLSHPDRSEAKWRELRLLRRSRSSLSVQVATLPESDCPILVIPTERSEAEAPICSAQFAHRGSQIELLAVHQTTGLHRKSGLRFPRLRNEGACVRLGHPVSSSSDHSRAIASRISVSLSGIGEVFVPEETPRCYNPPKMKKRSFAPAWRSVFFLRFSIFFILSGAVFSHAQMGVATGNGVAAARQTTASRE